jgi:TonB family protein
LGAFDTAVVISETMTKANEDRVSTAIAAYARPRGEAGETVSLFLGDAAGAALRRVAELRTCPPSLTNETQVQRRLEVEALALDELGFLPEPGAGSLRSVLWIFVGDDGRPAELRVYESSGRIPVDEAAVRIMTNAVFTPARTEGIPVAAWVQIPVRFQVIAAPRREPTFLPPPDFPG